eukprot:gene16977-20177_t
MNKPSRGGAQLPTSDIVTLICIIAVLVAPWIVAVTFSLLPEKDSPRQSTEDTAKHHAASPLPASPPPPTPPSDEARNYLGGALGGLTPEEQRLVNCSDRCESDSATVSNADDFLVYITEADPHQISFQTRIADEVTNASVILRTGLNASVNISSIDTYAQRVSWMSEDWIRHLDIAYPLRLVLRTATEHYNVAYIAYYHLLNTPREYTVVAKRVDGSPYGSVYTNYYDSSLMACFCADCKVYDMSVYDTPTPQLDAEMYVRTISHGNRCDDDFKFAMMVDGDVCNSHRCRKENDHNCHYVGHIECPRSYVPVGFTHVKRRDGILIGFTIRCMFRTF